MFSVKDMQENVLHPVEERGGNPVYLSPYQTPPTPPLSPCRAQYVPLQPNAELSDFWRDKRTAGVGREWGAGRNGTGRFI